MGKMNPTAAKWNNAYKDGKYDHEAAIPFIHDIISTVELYKLGTELGFYPGCGNGRNFIPLVKAGLRLEGNDISDIAIKQLLERFPAAQVTIGDFLTHTPTQPYAYLISVQLFQHGNTQAVRQLFTKAHALLRPGGLLFLRVNSIGTQIVQQCQETERSDYGSRTIQYMAGQKTGLAIHFYSAEEIHALTEQQYSVVMPLREEFIPREDNTYWVQWEAILQKKDPGVRGS